MSAAVDWDAVETVLLDMDGTLLDLHYDNHFWQVHVPLRYAEIHALPHTEALAKLGALYDNHRGTLASRITIGLEFAGVFRGFLRHRSGTTSSRIRNVQPLTGAPQL